VTELSNTAKNLTRITEQLAAECNPKSRVHLLNLVIDEENQLGFGLEQLEIIDSRIASGHQLIARQRALVAQLVQDGQDTKLAEAILASLMHCQTLFEVYKRSIVVKLDRRIF
jgi:hypothetical protein